MATEPGFHRFADLLPELQLQIWAYAAGEPPFPGAHFFTLIDNVSANNNLSLALRAALNRTAGKGFLLTAPRTEPFGSRWLSWTKSNKSAYLVKERSGLWNACRTSRMVIRKMADTEGQASSPVSAPYKVIIKGRCEQLTIFPMTDLVCIQPWVFWESMFKDIDTVAGHDGGWWPGFETTHLAMEFNPGWPSKLEHGPVSVRPDPARVVLDSAFGSVYSSLTHLWFIDYTIQRRALGGLLGQNARQFRGKGFNFTEVTEDDSGWDLSSTGIFHWLRRMRDSVSNYEISTDSKRRLIVGVLACEELVV